MSDIIEKMNQVWAMVSQESLPDLIVVSEERRFRSVRRWRGKRFCLRISIMQAYHRAIQWRTRTD